MRIYYDAAIGGAGMEVEIDKQPIEGRISGLTKIGEFRLARWTNRRQLEWKTSASVWLFLVALCSAIAAKKLPYHPHALGIFLAIVISIHFWWVHQNWKRNQEDIKAAFDYFEEIHGLSSTRPIPKRIRQEPRCMFQDAVPTCEIAITALLSVAAFYLTIILN